MHQKGKATIIFFVVLTTLVLGASSFLLLTKTKKPEIKNTNNAQDKQNQTCLENWSCGEWGACKNGIQTRACIDLNNCGTSYNKPITSRFCKEQTSEKNKNTCGDGKCNLPEENIYSCWQDCKPEFNTGNFTPSRNSPKPCLGKPTEPKCCTTHSQYVQYDSYYTCDYI